MAPTADEVASGATAENDGLSAVAGDIGGDTRAVAMSSLAEDPGSVSEGVEQAAEGALVLLDTNGYTLLMSQ